MNVEERAFRVLVVEDDDDHAELTVFHMRRAIPWAQIYRYDDGEEALNRLLSATGEDADSDLDLVVLDLKLRTIDGLSVLRKLREAGAARLIPIVVFSTSASPRDISAAYELYANSYVVKPDVYEDYKDTIGRLVAYWSTCNRRVSTGARR